MNITVNTKVVKTNVEKLKNIQKYYTTKKNVFSPSSFGSCYTLANYLTKIQSIYSDIATNILNIYTYLEDYNSDIEGLENQSSGFSGSIKAENVNEIIRKYKNILTKYTIDESELFTINYVNQANSSSNSTYSPYSENYQITNFKTATAFIFSLFEGALNVVENVVDAGAMIVAKAQSVMGNEEQAQSIANFVGEDISQNIYHKAMDFMGIEDFYTNSIFSTIGSVGGNILTYVGATVLTAGLATEAGAALAGASGAVSIGNASISAAQIGAGISAGVNATLGAATNMGSESESAMQRGANFEQAFDVGVSGAAIGGIADAFTGYLGGLARSGVGIGQTVKETIASFVGRATEPILNEVAHTAIYDHDANADLLTLSQNFIENANEYGLLGQVLMSGGQAALGTFVNGVLGNLKLNENSSNNLESEIPSQDGSSTSGFRQLTLDEIETKIREYKRILYGNEDLRRIIENEKKGLPVEIYDDVYDDYIRLKTIQAEINAGKGNISDAKINTLKIPKLKLADDYLKYLSEIEENPVSFFQKNLDYFMFHFICFDEYVQKVGINIDSYTFDYDSLRRLALDFNDKNMILYFKAHDMIFNLEKSDPNSKFLAKLKAAAGIDRIEKTSSTIKIDEFKLERLMRPYLNDADLEVLDSIGTSAFKSNLTDEQRAAIYQFTKCGGCNIDMYLRGKKYYFNSLEELERAVNGRSIGYYGSEEIARKVSTDRTIIDEMDEIIDAYACPNIVRASRYMDSLPMFGGITPLNIDSFIGKSYTDDAYGSFSLINNGQTGYSNKYIKMNAIISPNSGALIQGASGLGLTTSEFLVKRGYTVTIIDGNYDNNLGQIVLDVLITVN